MARAIFNAGGAVVLVDCLVAGSGWAGVCRTVVDEIVVINEASDAVVQKIGVVGCF